MATKERLRISLKAARVNAGFLQMDVAQAIGVSVATLVNWENGKTIPPVDRAQELASLYGLCLDDINFCKTT